MYKTLTEDEISGLDVSSALPYREQIYAAFHNVPVNHGGRERVCLCSRD